MTIVDVLTALRTFNGLLERFVLKYKIQELINAYNLLLQYVEDMQLDFNRNMHDTQPANINKVLMVLQPLKTQPPAGMSPLDLQEFNHKLQNFYLLLEQYVQSIIPTAGSPTEITKGMILKGLLPPIIWGLAVAGAGTLAYLKSKGFIFNSQNRKEPPSEVAAQGLAYLSLQISDDQPEEGVPLIVIENGTDKEEPQPDNEEDNTRESGYGAFTRN